jgi:hypothetical protein
MQDAYHLAAFASALTKRLEGGRDTTLVDDLQAHIRGLPLPPSSAVTAKQDELDRLGTGLWNLSTRLRRDASDPDDRSKEKEARGSRALALLRAYSFLLLDTAGGQGTKGRKRKSCVRLMKVALKAAKVCIEGKELNTATKVLERAAEYQEFLGKATEDEVQDDVSLVDSLLVEYFAVRTTLVSATRRNSGVLRLVYRLTLL